ncbi:lysophospholipid acyltransferase family protein [Mycolicibacter algericus]|uniref:1-acyl-sn-glycerol-3-phosphate acyltransferase n=2 Tax=Mycolicibacter algericus TaxID=1288388 RepID=A0A7I9YBE7_MYCAL|nr:lysophospholipid acyltransferase family protein [Mycolicibacter algericus]OQZ99419.1 1-acyl-sn-glycerol-3-phosphate acyltransferase [Mycolicibacter algericus DSM 45454]GFG85852.1 1-acyl-sn-glycerol-3-phosphate acyltransferase [Mycolicibacter algericus]
MNGAASHPWAPRGFCTPACVHGGVERVPIAVVALRLALAVLLVPVLPLLAVPIPARLQRGCCRLLLRCFGVRVAITGGPVRNLRGMLVVSTHASWLDVFVVGAVSPGTFVARADLISWPGIGALARLMRVIPIDRDSLLGLPSVVEAVAARLRAGRTVVAFPEGTTWCGRAHGRFYPAMFQAAVDASRPVQPLRVGYRHPDGSRSTLPAFVGDDTLVASMGRLITARHTVAQVHVASLQLPGSDRRELAARCQAAVGCRALPSRPACIFC